MVRVNLGDIHTLNIEQLADRVSDPDRPRSPDELRRAVVEKMYDDYGPFDLCDSETNDIIRDATLQETIESALFAGPEGHILVDGRRCYVSE